MGENAAVILEMACPMRKKPGQSIGPMGEKFDEKKKKVNRRSYFSSRGNAELIGRARWDGSGIFSRRVTRLVTRAWMTKCLGWGEVESIVSVFCEMMQFLQNWRLNLHSTFEVQHLSSIWPPHPSRITFYVNFVDFVWAQFFLLLPYLPG